MACKRTGGIRFKFEGNGYWLLVYVMNVGGAGDIKTMAVKGSRTNWINMSHNWGASYQAFSSLYGQSLSFRLTSYTTRQTIYAWNAAPASWSAGQTYKSNANFSWFDWKGQSYGFTLCNLEADRSRGYLIFNNSIWLYVVVTNSCVFCFVHQWLWENGCLVNWLQRDKLLNPSCLNFVFFVLTLELMGSNW